MTKREKVLLQILICITIVGVLTVYVLLPAVKTYIRLGAQYDETSQQVTDMQMVLGTDGIEEGMNVALDRADGNYKFFNGKINSYNIDDMINGLVSDNNMVITSLSIGEYEELSDEELIPSGDVEEDDYFFDDEWSDEEEEKLLLGCSVSFNVRGSYEDMLNLIDDLNASSDCIDIVVCNYTRSYANLGDEELAEIEEYLTVNIQLTLYGLKPYEMEVASY